MIFTKFYTFGNNIVSEPTVTPAFPPEFTGSSHSIFTANFTCMGPNSSIVYFSAQLFFSSTWIYTEKRCNVLIKSPISYCTLWSIDRCYDLHNRVFPDIWKLAIVTSELNKGNLHDLNNYIHISVLKVILKIFDKIVHVYLYISLRPQIVPHQHTCLKDTQHWILWKLIFIISMSFLCEESQFIFTGFI